MNDLTLLYVEDDKEALDDVVFLLKKYFTTIYTAVDGEEGLKLFKKKSIDIVLLDINMPKINGLELASIIREIDMYIPIIFLTAHSETQKLLNAINLQATSYVIKPFKLEELKDSIFEAVHLVKKEKNVGNKILLNNDFYWNKINSELYYKKELLILTKKEILLISLLFENRSTFFTASQISKKLFKNEKNETNNTVQIVSRLKNKISKKINKDVFFIENIYSQGYGIK